MNEAKDEDDEEQKMNTSSTDNRREKREKGVSLSCKLVQYTIKGAGFKTFVISSSRKNNNNKCVKY